ncbi:TetR/AcrR family transcriptional regulator [Actinomadura rupiterrae]|uniref:TetR/AcrR family transcriptional regulator n=1 Tax=Actinomadura rupiterrae TaxID=559627 RepID=UPI0020A487A0|nr:TetR/AcrR family transcriptional regulator [Actinomadura rupiterrae]MCP2340722.1 AcrR family transcriptional regulator [Actinomadura rupiterrae]
MPERSPARDRIVAAAADLLVQQGREAVTTRAVSAAAGVQPPAIYRLFGDMSGLLEAVAADGFARYLKIKNAQPRAGDPVDDLRAGWDLHIGFGLDNPAQYRLMSEFLGPGSDHPAAQESRDILRGLVERVAEAGRLAIGIDQAAEMMLAAGVGVTLTLLDQAPERRDPGLSERTREAVIAAVTTDRTAPEDREPSRRAVALRAVLDESSAEFTPGERLLLDELLARLSPA